jgi:hypothetical protein
MSSSVWYKCITDGAASESVGSYMDAVLDDLASVRGQLAEVMAADTRGYFEFELMAHGSSVVGWLLEHKDHHIMLEHEYHGLTELTKPLKVDD